MSRRALVVIVLACAAPAVADPKADALFEKAQTAYQAGQYQAAIRLFEQAYDLVHDPVYLFNIAQSYRKVLDCESASDYYTRYLDAAPDADAKQREKITGWLRELQPCVDQRRAEHEAVKRAHDVEAQRRADDATRPRAATRVDRGRPLRIAGVVIGGVGAVGLSVGIIYSIKGRSLRNELADACMPTCDFNDPALRDKDDAGQRANTIAAIGWIGGGAAVLAGAGLYLWGRTKVETVTITPTASGAAVTARLTF